MIGSAIKCDVCNKVDVHEPNSGSQNPMILKWFRVTSPQTAMPMSNYKHDDICSLKCLQEYSQGWTSN